MNGLSSIIDFRQELHKVPELSNKEVNTSRMVLDFMKQFSPDKIIENV